MLLCAGILGRYYTDWHNVDEDLTTIPYQGGQWNYGNSGGIVYRDLLDVPTNSGDDVASLRNK